MKVYVGTAGWRLPREWQDRFPGGGTHLTRYAHRLDAVEINSTFYRSHRPTTYARWAASVPPEFRFAVKVPRQLTHQARLTRPELLEPFLEEVSHLGEKLGPLLVQVPPSLAWEETTGGAFLAALGERHAGGVALEPRHPSWFTPAVDRLLRRRRVARVAADPGPVPAATRPGGWPGLVYFRLHGAPEMYRSAYEPTALRRLARRLREAARGAEVWCIFNNTAAGAATGNALELRDRLNRAGRGPARSRDSSSPRPPGR